MKRHQGVRECGQNTSQDTSDIRGCVRVGERYQRREREVDLSQGATPGATNPSAFQTTPSGEFRKFEVRF